MIIIVITFLWLLCLRSYFRSFGSLSFSRFMKWIAIKYWRVLGSKSQCDLYLCGDAAQNWLLNELLGECVWRVRRMRAEEQRIHCRVGGFRFRACDNCAYHIVRCVLLFVAPLFGRIVDFFSALLSNARSVHVWRIRYPIHIQFKHIICYVR